MRRGLAYLCMLAVAGLGGCAFFETEHSASWLKRRHVTPPLAPDTVQMVVALLERPLGDPYLNHELWTNADEQIVGPEYKAAVDDNGFRVGQIVGMPPGKFQVLSKCPRSCPKAHENRFVQSGYTVKQELGPAGRPGSYRVKQNGHTEEVALDNVLYQLEITPSLTSDGRIRLRFTPRVEYGEVSRSVYVLPDRSDWAMRIEKPSKSYPNLAWEVTVAPNEFLVIGGNYDLPQSLGYQALVQEEAPTPVQRLLVIRTSRSLPKTESTPTPEDSARAGQSPPLALQATMTAN